MLNRKAHYWRRWLILLNVSKPYRRIIESAKMHLSSLIIWENFSGMLMGKYLDANQFHLLETAQEIL